MAVSFLDRVASLRKSAEHARALAQSAIPFAVAKEIERFASDLEIQATKLEQRVVASPPAGRRKSRDKRSGDATIDRHRGARRSVLVG
jgi:hypothetical protein